jgi:hypothetical protein
MLQAANPGSFLSLVVWAYADMLRFGYDFILAHVQAHESLMLTDGDGLHD